MLLILLTENTILAQCAAVLDDLQGLGCIFMLRSEIIDTPESKCTRGLFSEFNVNAKLIVSQSMLCCVLIFEFL